MNIERIAPSFQQNYIEFPEIAIKFASHILMSKDNLLYLLGKEKLFSYMDLAPLTFKKSICETEEEVQLFLDAERDMQNYVFAYMHKFSNRDHFFQQLISLLNEMISFTLKGLRDNKLNNTNKTIAFRIEKSHFYEKYVLVPQKAKEMVIHLMKDKRNVDHLISGYRSALSFDAKFNNFYITEDICKTDEERAVFEKITRPYSIRAENSSSEYQIKDLHCGKYIYEFAQKTLSFGHDTLFLHCVNDLLCELQDHYKKNMFSNIDQIQGIQI